MWENLWGLSYIHALFLLFPAQLLSKPCWRQILGSVDVWRDLLWLSLYSNNTLLSCASVVSGEIWAVY